jgi:A/G-specific adenine glycosylase
MTDEVNKAGKRFRSQLLKWNKTSNHREMPWKGIKDPYRIWLSEVILQQTRVEQGLKYYEKFISSFPTVHDLAGAPDALIFKHWEGLGYYSRCKNLITTARFISTELGGSFPSQYPAILELKGVGEYTAAAIASFAFDLPYAVVDGNVLRVLSRITGTSIPVDSVEGKKYFKNLAQTILPPRSAAEYNQAIMDFGATICKPQPICDQCFFSKDCIAFKKKEQLKLPVKEKKLTITTRYFYYFFTDTSDHVLVRQRTGNDIWQSLYEFPLVEIDEPEPAKAIQLIKKSWGPNPISNPEIIYTSKQKLTHQNLCFTFYRIELNRKKNLPGYSWIRKEELKELAFPRSLGSFLNIIADLL